MNITNAKQAVEAYDGLIRFAEAHGLDPNNLSKAMTLLRVVVNNSGVTKPEAPILVKPKPLVVIKPKNPNQTSEEAILRALWDGPKTVRQLRVATGLSEMTVTKWLCRLHNEGRIQGHKERHPGKGKIPVVWSRATNFDLVGNKTGETSITEQQVEVPNTPKTELLMRDIPSNDLAMLILDKIPQDGSPIHIDHLSRRIVNPYRKGRTSRKQLLEAITNSLLGRVVVEGINCRLLKGDRET
jgi:hypothetical protein